MNELSIFSARMRLSDLISANHNLILMLPRLGISLGFGDKSVQEVCEQYHLPVDFFMLICNVYTFAQYSPSDDEISQTDMSPLLPYLRASHQYYLQGRLEHIDQHVHLLAASLEEKFGRVLCQFFDDYISEVRDHFDKEEAEVFPYLEALQEGGNPVEDPRIYSYDEAHESIKDKLADLTQIIFKYLPANAFSNDAIDLIFDILQTAGDLEKHALIEEKILLPYIEHLAIHSENVK